MRDDQHYLDLNTSYLEDMNEQVRLWFEDCDIGILARLIDNNKNLTLKQKAALIWVMHNPNRINEIIKGEM